MMVRIQQDRPCICRSGVGARRTRFQAVPDRHLTVAIRPALKFPDAGYGRRLKATRSVTTPVKGGQNPFRLQEPTKKAPKGFKQVFDFKEKDGGRARARTVDPLIKSQLLYQLSYAPHLFRHRNEGAYRPDDRACPHCFFHGCNKPVIIGASCIISAACPRQPAPLRRRSGRGKLQIRHSRYADE